MYIMQNIFDTLVNFYLIWLNYPILETEKSENSPEIKILYFDF